MAFFHIIKNGAKISGKRVGTNGTHRDESNILRLDGKAQRNPGWRQEQRLGRTA